MCGVTCNNIKQTCNHITVEYFSFFFSFGAVVIGKSDVCGCRGDKYGEKAKRKFDLSHYFDSHTHTRLMNKLNHKIKTM